MSNKKNKPKKEVEVKTSSEESKFKTPHVYQRDKVNFEFLIKELPWTEKQKQLIELGLNKNVKCVFIKGPAGSSKTLTAVYLALHLLKAKKVSDIIFVRSAVESADSKIGYLPGTIDEKLEAYMVPFMEKIDELLQQNDKNKLKNDSRFSTTPVNYIRGLHWPAKCIIVDECQSITMKELITTITRIGQFSKVFLLGDPKQTDLPAGKAGGFESLYNLFSDEESREQGIYTFEFTEEDIVRSDFVKFIVRKLEQINERIRD
jgi:phosphate starvation-inducible PhoH-like protein